MDKDTEYAIQGRINDLNKTIKEMKKEINDAETVKFFSKILTGLITGAALLVGWGFGKIIDSVPIMMFLTTTIGAISSSTFLGRIVDSRTIIQQAQHKIETCEDEIIDLNMTLLNSKTKSAKKSATRSSQAEYSYSHKRSASDEEFSKRIAEFREEGFFDGLDDKPKKR